MKYIWAVKISCERWVHRFKLERVAWRRLREESFGNKLIKELSFRSDFIVFFLRIRLEINLFIYRDIITTAVRFDVWKKVEFRWQNGCGEGKVRPVGVCQLRSSHRFHFLGSDVSGATWKTPFQVLTTLKDEEPSLVLGPLAPCNIPAWRWTLLCLASVLRA